MQRVLESAGLTYHYSTQRIDATRFHYVLDATTGEDHSPLGTEEENPADEAKRLELLYQSGQASQSAIQAFDLWGLLKIGSAPIKNSVGEIVGIIGADVNISVIRSKTALLATFVLLSGAIGLLLAALVSRVVTERILQPITSIRDGALQIAGGNYQQCFQVGRPREAAELSDSLNSMRAALAESVSSLESQCLEYRQRRDVQDLAATLERSNPPSSSGDGSQNTVKQQVYRSDSLLQARLCWQGAALLWASKRLPDPLAEAQLLYSVRLVCQQLSALELPAPELLNLLQRLLPSAVGVALLFDAAGQSVQCLRNSLGQELLFFELEDGPQLTFQEVSKRSTQVAEHAWLRAPIPSFTQEGIE
jgi:HAMP domain-containing protein